MTSTDSGYNGATARSVAVSVNDDDDAGVSVSEDSLTIGEGGDGTYTIVLDSAPTADVTVTINDPTDNTDVTVALADPDVHLNRLGHAADGDGERRDRHRHRRRGGHRDSHRGLGRHQLQRRHGRQRGPSASPTPESRCPKTR